MPTSWLSAKDANRILTLVGCEHAPVIAGTTSFNQWLDHVLNHLEHNAERASNLARRTRQGRVPLDRERGRKPK
jgi:hypothetical protein